MDSIIFSGANHYGLGALLSIQKYFRHVFIHSSSSEDVKKQIRPTDKIIDDFNDCDCEYVFLAGHVELITKEQLAQKKYLNVHGALLPKYRGMHSTFWAIMNGEERLGITFHVVDEGMDSGPIIAQFDFPYYGQGISEINSEIDKLVGVHSGDVLSRFMRGELNAIPQDENKVVFGARRNLKDCIVDFYMPNYLLRRFFKALTPPYPLPRVIIKKKTYEITAMEIIDRDYYGPIGRCVNNDARGVWVKTKEGFLIISGLRDCENSMTVNPREIVGIGYRFYDN